MEEYCKEKNESIVAEENRREKRKDGFVSVLFNQTLMVLTVIALMLLSKALMPNVYSKVKTAFSDSYPAKTDVSEVFDTLTDKLEAVPVFDNLAEDAKDKPLMIKEEAEIREMSLENGQGDIYCRPVNGGSVIRGYGTYESEDGKRLNNSGMDIGISLGTSVVAVKDGTVKESSESAEYGKYIIIDHKDGLETVYAHLLCPLCAEGSEVVSGQRIALSGKCGDEAMLHFETVLDGKRVNPLQYITP